MKKCIFLLAVIAILSGCMSSPEDEGPPGKPINLKMTVVVDSTSVVD